MGISLREMVKTLRFHGGLIHSALESIDSECLEIIPIKNSGSFGKQFRHMLDVRNSYLDALQSGTFDFYRKDINHLLENNKQELLEELKCVMEEFSSIVLTYSSQKVSDKWIDCTPSMKYLGENFRNISPLQLTGMITEHEIFHEGELALYYRATNIKFPDNWIVWGLV
ncbi:DinB family protein [Ferroplasma acidiphilum]|uniref:DinB family protein n=1 Tax=Ferroplasma acidiphilum TaxID=74969 RepID=UPI0023EF9D6A|nr:DinB family protein [Ferroplasma acidiphilum]